MKNIPCLVGPVTCTWSSAESLDGLLLATVATCVKSSQSPSQSVGVLCSHWVIQHSLSSFGDSDRVSGPSDSGSRSTSGDTGEGELRTGPIEVRVHS